MQKWIPSCLVGLAFLAVVSAKAQGSEPDTARVQSLNNMIKLNLSSLILKNFSLQYERRIGKRTTVALNGHWMPFGRLSLSQIMKRVINDPAVPVQDFRLGISGIVPEFRYYLSKRGAFQGFYLGAFLAYNEYKTDLPITYDNDTKTGVFNGKLTTLTGGLQIGAQWNLGRRVYLDWWIIGPNFGNAKGDLDFRGPLTPSEQDDIRQGIEEIKEDVPVNSIKSYEVNSQGAFIDVKGPWLGLRGMAFNLGFRF